MANAKIFGNAKVYGNAKIFCKALVMDNAKVYGNARVYDTAKIFGNAKVYGNAAVYGEARVHGSNMVVYGDAIISTTLLTANRSDGYTFAIAMCKDGNARIMAGCRYFTHEEAIAHWLATRSGTKLGQESLQIVEHLYKMFALQEG